MIDLDNQTDLDFKLKTLERISNFLSHKDIELIIVDDKTMRSLNTKHREKAQVTDVLSFPLETDFIGQSLEMPLGSIVISASLVKEKARLLGHSIEDELSLLFIHGMLHLQGFDHETDDEEMRTREKELIELFDLPKSLIVRTEEY